MSLLRCKDTFNILVITDFKQPTYVAVAERVIPLAFIGFTLTGKLG